MKDKILLTLGVASCFCVFGVRSVIGCVGYNKYKPDLYNYNQGDALGKSSWSVSKRSLSSIEQTVNPLSHRQLVALTWDDVKGILPGIIPKKSENQEDPKQGDQEDPKQGDQEDPKQGDQEDPKQGDQEDPKQGDQEDPKQGDQEDPKQCLKDYRQCIDDSQEDVEERKRCREDLRQCREDTK